MRTWRTTCRNPLSKDNGTGETGSFAWNPVIAVRNCASKKKQARAGGFLSPEMASLWISNLRQALNR